MFLVLPATSAVRPTSYLGPQSYEYLPDQGYYPYHGTPRFAVSSHPSQPEFFRQPSAEELEEREYRQALEVIANHRHRQAEKQAAIRRQQLAQAARQQYFAWAAELEQRRQEEFLAARRAEFIHSQRARARLVAAGRQHALDAFLRQPEGAQPVRHVCGIPVAYSILIGPSSQITRQPQVIKRKSLADILNQRLAAESDTDVTEPIKNILSSLESRPAQSEKPKDSNEDAAELIENLLSSIFPGLMLHTQSQSTPSTEQAKPSVSDKGKEKARAVDFEEPKKTAPKLESAGEAFADILRHVMETSKATPTRRSPNEAGPSRPSPSLSTAQPAVTEKEQAQIDRAIALSSVENVQSTLTKLRADFVLPTELDHYATPTDDRDETASILSVSSSNVTRLIPFTNTNKPVYKYENELNGLLEELDKIDSHGDAEVREKRKEVVKAVEKALEGVEHVVGEVVEKRLSFVSSVAEESLRGFDVDEEVTEEVTPAPEEVEAPVVVYEVSVPEPSTPNQVEENIATPAEGYSPVDEPLHEFNTPTVSETTTESDVEASTVTITPVSVEPTFVTKPEPMQSQVQVNAPETVDTFLLPERVSPLSPVLKAREIDVDTDEDILVLDSDGDKSDWSELEGH